MRLLESFKKSLPLIPGYHTKRKIVVIESDDWGSIRTASKKSYDILLKKGYPVDKNPYTKYDALESNEDLASLLEVLSSVKNIHGKSPKITINFITANPDFEAIQSNNFESYHFENSIQTRSRYSNTGELDTLYRQGIEDDIILPQLHGREHLNVNRWMKGLQNEYSYLLDAFEQNMFSLKWTLKNEYPNEYMDAFDFESLTEVIDHKRILEDAVNLFQEQWGFKSKSFIACCYIWHTDLNEKLSNLGITYLQGLSIQHQPVSGSELKYEPKLHYTGQKNSHGQRFLVRNAFFEPSVYPNLDSVDICLKRIELAFLFNKPAIISSHRVNFMGRLNLQNRQNNLKQFKKLLQLIVAKWPNIEFMFSDELGDTIRQG